MSNQTSTFTITATPNTDIWRKPPQHIAFNAPTHPTPLSSPSNSHPLSKFKSARVTFALPPLAKLTQYDQAGLLLRLSRTSEVKEESGKEEGSQGSQSKWLKTGVEFYEGAPYVSTVGCDAWADWSVVPLSAIQNVGDGAVEATVEVRREGMGLWVYAVTGTGEGEKRIPLREVTWFFAEEEGWSLSVAAYAARPGEGNQGESGLVAEFRGLEVCVG